VVRIKAPLSATTSLPEIEFQQASTPWRSDGSMSPPTGRSPTRSSRRITRRSRWSRFSGLRRNPSSRHAQAIPYATTAAADQVRSSGAGGGGRAESWDSTVAGRRGYRFPSLSLAISPCAACGFCYGFFGWRDAGHVSTLRLDYAKRGPRRAVARSSEAMCEENRDRCQRSGSAE